MKRFRKLLFVFFIILVGASFSACSAGQATTASPEAPAAEEIPPVVSSRSVMAEGRVVPAQEADLGFSTMGVVGEVLVKEGDAVAEGQPIVRLVGDEQLQSAIAAADFELVSAQQSLQELKDQAGGEHAAAQLAVAEATKELDKAEKRLFSKDYRRGDQEQIDIARSNYVLAEEEVDNATKLYDQVDDRDESDPVRANAFSYLAATRQKRDQALGNLNYLLSKPNEMDVAQIDAQLAVAQSNLAEAQRRLERLKDGPDPDQLTLAEKRVETAQANLEAAKAKLVDLELTAPFAGTVSSIDVTEGEFVSPGTAVVHIADFSNWLVETSDLTELNVSRVATGQPAMIHFDALPDTGLIGRVVTIRPFGENRQGDIVYTVVLKLEAPVEQLRWNMTASVEFLEKEIVE